MGKFSSPKQRGHKSKQPSYVEGRGGGLGQKLFFIHTPKLGQFEGFLPVRIGSGLNTQFVTGLSNKIFFLWPLKQTLVKKKHLTDL